MVCFIKRAQKMLMTCAHVDRASSIKLKVAEDDLLIKKGLI